MESYVKYIYRIYRDRSGSYLAQYKVKDCNMWYDISSFLFPNQAEQACRAHAIEKKQQWELARQAGVYKELGELP